MTEPTAESRFTTTAIPPSTRDGHRVELPPTPSKHRSLHLPITLNVLLMALNITLMVCWIVLLAQAGSWSALTIGTVVFALMLIGLIVYLVITVKEVRLNRRQSNFVDAVTHELKSPIASLRLYLETLRMREVGEEQRAEFYQVMGDELTRLDTLINHLLEVGRLDAIGGNTATEEIPLEEVLHRSAQAACTLHQCNIEEVFQFDIDPVVIQARAVVLDMIFGNLLDNAVKYAGSPPRVSVRARMWQAGRTMVEICDNGEGVPKELHKKIFQIFYRGGNELERKQKGTGLGLYIARTLVHLLRGRISVSKPVDGRGSIFAVELPAQRKV